MNYFVTSYGIEIASNLTKEQAIKKAQNTDKECIGIGQYKMSKGKKVYTLLPAHFYMGN